MIPENEQLIEVPIVIPSEVHPHLLIDYTAFLCANCPTAAEQAHSLKDIYGAQLIVVAIHPPSYPLTQGLYDYTCEDGDVYFQWMGGTTSTYFPTGNIDMIPREGNYMTDYLDWPERVRERMADTTDIHLMSSAKIDMQTREIQICTNAYSNREQKSQLVIWLTEDSIAGAQMMPDGKANMEYTHRHVLRDAIGEPWGKTITVSPEPYNDTISTTLPAKYHAEQCYIVTLLLDPEDRHVLNAKEINILQ